MNWTEAIRQWRALPEAEKHRRRWASIPRSVARSFAFEGEPVDQAMLEAEHAGQSMPPAVAMSKRTPVSLDPQLTRPPASPPTVPASTPQPPKPSKNVSYSPWPPGSPPPARKQ